MPCNMCTRTLKASSHACCPDTNSCASSMGGESLPSSPSLLLPPVLEEPPLPPLPEPSAGLGSSRMLVTSEESVEGPRKERGSMTASDTYRSGFGRRTFEREAAKNNRGDGGGRRRGRGVGKKSSQERSVREEERTQRRRNWGSGGGGIEVTGGGGGLRREMGRGSG